MNGEDRGEYILRDGAVTECGPPRNETALTRGRYMELVVIAQELCEWVKSKGVKPDETCKLNSLVHDMINLKP